MGQKIMAENTKELEDKAEGLKEDVAGLKADVHELNKILLDVEVAKGKKKDEKELEEIDHEIDEL